MTFIIGRIFVMNFIDGLFHGLMHFRIVSQQLHQCSHAVDVGFIGVFAIATDNFILELTYGFITIERYLPDVFAEVSLKIA